MVSDSEFLIRIAAWLQVGTKMRDRIEGLSPVFFKTHWLG